MFDFYSLVDFFKISDTFPRHCDVGLRNLHFDSISCVKHYLLCWAKRSNLKYFRQAQTHSGDIKFGTFIEQWPVEPIDLYGLFGQQSSSTILYLHNKNDNQNIKNHKS